MKITDDRILDGLDYLCCQKEICIGAYDLINRQKAEIERLQENEQIATAVIAESSAEIERLKSDNDILSKNIHNLCKELDAEKLKNF